MQYMFVASLRGTSSGNEKAAWPAVLQDDQLVITSRQVCQGCTVAQRAVEELRQQMEPLQRSLSVRGGNLAESMPSTQDRSGDTNDDR